MPLPSIHDALLRGSGPTGDERGLRPSLVMATLWLMLAVASLGQSGPPYPWQNHTLPVSVSTCTFANMYAWCAPHARPYAVGADHTLYARHRSEHWLLYEHIV